MTKGALEYSLDDRIYVAGAYGMVGRAISRELHRIGYNHIITPTRAQLDLTDQAAVRNFFESENIDVVYLAAAKVGGIFANSTYPADFIYHNLMIQANVIESAFRNDVRNLLFLGSSCIYPKLASQPMNEEALLTGPLEPTNEPYAVAKIAGIKLCESYNRQYGESHGIDYRSVMPTNLYGPGDNYHPENSHVIPALIRRFYSAKIDGAPAVTVWGTGSPMREFLYVDDMAAACVHVMQLSKGSFYNHTNPIPGHINVGAGTDISISELAHVVAKAVGYSGEILFDVSKPDGAPRKLLNSNRLQSTGWSPRTALVDGITMTVADYISTST